MSTPRIADLCIRSPESYDVYGGLLTASMHRAIVSCEWSRDFGRCAHRTRDMLRNGDGVAVDEHAEQSHHWQCHSV
eukprot:4828265-Amphidinium_carterae.1